jgi:type I restriction enzyme S subunit
MVPSGWTIENLGNICEINPRKIQKTDDGQVSFITMNQLSEEGQMISHASKPYEEVSKGFTSFQDGDVLVAKITPCFENGKGALVEGLVNGVGFGSTEFHVLRANKNSCSEFIYYLTRTRELRVKGEMNMQGSAGHRRVTTDYFYAFKVKTPPLPEQRKIAKILSTWDKAISTTERLIDNSKQQKKALMQQLLTGKKRLLDDSGKLFEGEWKDVTLGEISYITTGSSNREDSFLDAEFTFFDRSEDIRTSSRYLFDAEAVIVAGEGQDFVPKYFEGKFDLHQRTYAIMKFRQSYGKFIFYYIGYYRHYFLSQAVGSTVKSLRLPMFQKMPIKLPNELEQQKIAAVLSNSDSEIKLLKQQLVDLKQEKKALMQQLLTGKRRVKVDEKEVA